MWRLGLHAQVRQAWLEAWLDDASSRLLQPDLAEEELVVLLKKLRGATDLEWAFGALISRDWLVNSISQVGA